MPTVRTPLHTKLANQHTPNSIHADPKVRFISFKFTYMCHGTMYIYIYIYIYIHIYLFVGLYIIYIYFFCLSVCLSVYLIRKDEAIHIKCISAKQRVLLFLLVLCHGNRAVFPKPQLSKNNKKLLHCKAWNIPKPHGQIFSPFDTYSKYIYIYIYIYTQHDAKMRQATFPCHRPTNRESL